MRRSSKGWAAGLVISLAAHAMVVAGLWLYFALSPSPGQATSDAGQAVRGGAAAADGPERTPDSLPDVRAMMAEQRRRADSMSPQEKMAELDRKRRELEKIPPESVNAITSLIERTLRVDGNRQYAPKEGAGGRFDADSAVLYDIRKKVRDGRTVYVHVLVDKDGHKIEAEVPESEMTADGRRAAAIMRWAGQSPRLRRLVDTVIKLHDRRSDNVSARPTGPAAEPATKAAER